MSAELTSLTPWLTVRSYAAAASFYTERLGFEWWGEGGDPPTLGAFRRGAATICICEPSWRRPEKTVGTGSVEIGVDDLEALRGEFAARGIDVSEHATVGPVDEVTGGPIWDEARLSDLVVTDPDGNRLTFQQDWPEEEP